MHTFLRTTAAIMTIVLSSTAGADCLEPQWEPRASASPKQLRHTLALADFDADGKLDAVAITVTAAIPDTVLFLRGHGDGTFAAPVTVHAATRMSQVVSADLDGDTKIDLLVGAAEALVFLPGRGDGTFGVPVVSPVPLSYRFSLEELTGDGIADVALLPYYESGPGSLVVLAGDGHGSFDEVHRQSTAGSNGAITAGHLDADGFADLIISYLESPAIDLLFGRGDGTFDPPVSRQSGMFAYSMTIADADADGDRDILTPNWYDDTVVVHRNMGERLFESTIYPLVIQTNTDENSPNSATVADVTGDGTLDLIVGAVNGEYIATLAGRGDGTFAPATFNPAFSFPGPVIAADLDGDGRVDLLTGNRVYGGIIFLRNRCGDIDQVRLTPLTPAIQPGQSATFHIKVSPASPHYAPVPTGEVSILKGDIVLATVQLSSGTASLTIEGLAPGAHALVARYSGDAQYEPAQSPIAVQSVGTTQPRRRSARH